MPTAGGAKRSGVSFAGVPETPLADARPASELASDILLYKNPVLSYLAAGAGALALGAAWFALRGAHGLTLLTGGCAAPAGGRAGGNGRGCTV